tara:strand:+ start:82 stop:192 length:111 start_codon:yes stop_codon:yes gene_type:complete
VLLLGGVVWDEEFDQRWDIVEGDVGVPLGVAERVGY